MDMKNWTDFFAAWCRLQALRGKHQRLEQAFETSQKALILCDNERQGLIDDIAEANQRIKALERQVGDLQTQAQDLFIELQRYLPTVDVSNVVTLDVKQIHDWFRARYPGCIIHWLDNTVWSTDEETTREILAEDWTSELEYIKDRWDCEDYAWHLRMMVMRKYGLNHIGVLYSQTHGFNFIVFPNFPEEGSIKWLEPQRDTIFKPVSGLFGEYEVKVVQI